MELNVGTDANGHHTSGARGNVVVHVAPGQADGAMSTAKGSPGAARFSAREREQRRRGCGQDVGGGEPALCPVPHLSLNSPGTKPFRSGRKNGLAFMARCSDRDASRAQIVICKTFGGSRAFAFCLCVPAGLRTHRRRIFPRVGPHLHVSARLHRQQGGFGGNTGQSS